MGKLKKIGCAAYRVYVGVGVAGIAVMSAGVIFAVIMRYFFHISYAFLEELITLIFTFTTFWGMGTCILENEHIVIDFFLLKMKPSLRRVIEIINYALVLAVNSVLFWFCIGWIQTAGKTISNGLRIKYLYIYSVMPLGVALAILCTVVKLVSLVRNTPLDLKPQEKRLPVSPGATV